MSKHKNQQVPHAEKVRWEVVNEWVESVLNPKTKIVFID